MAEASTLIEPESMGGFRENIRDPLALRMLAEGEEFELETILVGGRPRQVFKGLPRNLAQLYQAGMQYPGNTMVIDGETRFTYAEGFARAVALATAMRNDYGIGAGDVVAVVTVNRWEWIISTVAITPLELPSSSSLSVLTLPTDIPLYMTSVLLAWMPSPLSKRIWISIPVSE